MTPRSYSLRLFAALVILVLAAPTFTGCDGGDSDDDPPLIGGVDLNRLFADPTDAELQAVRADWAGRNTAPGAVAVEFEGDVLGDGSTVAILSHTTGDETFTHYGAVRVPPGDAPDGGWPVLVLNHGGDRGLDLPTYLSFIASPTESPFGVTGSQSVVVIPTFRSETMRGTPIGDLTAGGEPSPWDRDVDDAIALLNAALQQYPDATDEDRIGTLGISRGGAVSLLMAERDDRVDAVVDYFGPTDFTAASIEGLAIGLLIGDEDAQNQIRQVPGAIYLEETLLDPLAAGTLDYDTARLEVARRSSSFFANLLPETQAHHHECDAVVPFDQYVSLQAEEGSISGATEFYAYDAGCEDGTTDPMFHSFDAAVMPMNYERTAAFLDEYLVNAARPAFAE